MAFIFSDNEKFSLIAIDDCFSDIDSEVELSDETWVLPKMPADVGDQWAKWIGEIQMERLGGANLILVRRLISEKPEILDGEHMDLYQQVLDIFTVLQLSSVVCYADASALQGSFEKGSADIRQMVHLDQFYLTGKAPQHAVTIARLEEATAMAKVWRDLVKSGKYERFIRGGIILRDGLQQQYGQDRIHQFVRAIEALIRPDAGGTTFKKRAQTLGVKSAAAERILYESYEMRCDVEHVHAADRFLRKSYPDNEIESVATLRTRQMEVLARESYRRVLTDTEIRKHFETDDALNAFWGLSYDEQRTIWGEGIDVSEFKDDDEYQEKVRQLRERYPS